MLNSKTCADATSAVTWLVKGVKKPVLKDMTLFLRKRHWFPAKTIYQMWTVLHNSYGQQNSILHITSLKGILSGTVHEGRLSSCSFMACESFLESCVFCFTTASFNKSHLHWITLTSSSYLFFPQSQSHFSIVAFTSSCTQKSHQRTKVWTTVQKPHFFIFCKVNRR